LIPQLYGLSLAEHDSGRQFPIANTGRFRGRGCEFCGRDPCSPAAQPADGPKLLSTSSCDSRRVSSSGSVQSMDRVIHIALNAREVCMQRERRPLGIVAIAGFHPCFTRPKSLCRPCFMPLRAWSRWACPGRGRPL
jgi:hypothetical protein